MREMRKMRKNIFLHLQRSRQEFAKENVAPFDAEVFSKFAKVSQSILFIFSIPKK
jgi:hypothetical protein